MEKNWGDTPSATLTEVKMYSNGMNVFLLKVNGDNQR